MSAIAELRTARVPPTPKTGTPSEQLPGSQSSRDTHRQSAAGSLPAAHVPPDTQTHCGGGQHYELLLLAASLDDIEKTRVAVSNRLFAITEGDNGPRLPEDNIVVASTRLLLDALKAAEQQSTLALEKAMRRHWLAGWVKGNLGVGEKQAARLIAAVGDPTWNEAHERPRRGPAEFWQYCGHGDPMRSRRRRGQQVEFSPEAKMRTHLIAVSCMKQMRSPYRAVYDEARSAWADRDTSDGHKHNHALRLVGKALLKDLFLYAKQAKEEK